MKRWGIKVWGKDRRKVVLSKEDFEKQIKELAISKKKRKIKRKI